MFLRAFIAIVLYTPLVTSHSFNLTTFKIPEGFMIGASTSAYQTEGAWDVDGKGLSIQDVFYHSMPNLTKDGKIGDDACLSYYKFEEDVKAVKSMGMQHYRFSISWSRIMPTGLVNNINRKGLEHYSKVIDFILQQNITPVVQIYHWDLPEYLQHIGGWTNEALVDYFEDFAQLLFENYGDRVKWWSTINEPYFIAMGYEDGLGNAPRVNFTGIGAYLAGRVLLKAHARVYHLYDQVYRSKQNGKISIVLNGIWSKPQDQNNTEDLQAARRMGQFYMGWFAHPIYSKNGDYPKIMKDRIKEISLKQGFKRSRLPEFTKEEIEYIKGTSDYFSLNHYTAHVVTKAPAGVPDIPSYNSDRGVLEIVPDWPKSKETTWETIAPMSIRNIINLIRDSYDIGNMEILITENGFADSGELNDQTRIEYLATYLINVLKAIYLDGCNVVGYTVWSLIDGFEWTPGYEARFGLIHVNYSDPEKKRTPKQSSFFMKKIIETRKIPRKYYRLNQKLNELEGLRRANITHTGK